MLVIYLRSNIEQNYFLVYNIACYNELYLLYAKLYNISCLHHHNVLFVTEIFLKKFQFSQVLKKIVLLH